MEEKEEPVLITEEEEKVFDLEPIEIGEDEEEVVVDEYTDDAYGNTDVAEEDVDWSQFPDADEQLTEGGGVIELPEKEEEPLFEEPAAPIVDTPKVKSAGGFYRTTRQCNVRSGTNTGSDILNKVKKGTRLWVEPATKNWRTVYTRNGEAYMHKFCFRKQ
jgi:hypothetical protein